MTLSLVRIVNLEFVQAPEREMKSFSLELPYVLMVYVCMILRSSLLIHNPCSYVPVSFNVCVILLEHFFARERAFSFLIYFSTLSIYETIFVASKCVQRNSGWLQVSMHAAGPTTGHMDQGFP